MIQTVIKRDGRVVGYNEEKIKAAIRKAMLQTPLGEDEALIQKISDRIAHDQHKRKILYRVFSKFSFKRTHVSLSLKNILII